MVSILVQSFSLMDENRALRCVTNPYDCTLAEKAFTYSMLKMAIVGNMLINNSSGEAGFEGYR